MARDQTFASVGIKEGVTIDIATSLCLSQHHLVNKSLWNNEQDMVDLKKTPQLVKLAFNEASNVFSSLSVDIR